VNPNPGVERDNITTEQALGMIRISVNFVDDSMIFYVKIETEKGTALKSIFDRDCAL